MKFGVQELCDRYGIKSRKSLYSRLDGLSIALAKDGNKSYATDEQVKLLDQQHEHLKNGGTLKNFVPTAIAEVTVLKDCKSESVVETTQQTTYPKVYPLGQRTIQPSIQSILLGDIVEALRMAIIEAMPTAIASVMIPPDPLWYLERLETARAKGWELTTSQVKELIGVKPSSGQGKKTFRRGSFIFVKTGKIGNQTSWKVQKIND